MLDRFARVPAIRKMLKPCHLTLTEVLRKVDDEGRFDCQFVVSVAYSDVTVDIPVRWAMCFRNPKPHNWSSTLLVEKVRFDGVDSEFRYVDAQGKRQTGWHRHIWNSAEEHADSKECLPAFGKFDTKDDFVRDVTLVLGIVLKEDGGEEYGTTGLLFPQG